MSKRLTSVRQLEVARRNIERQKSGNWLNMTVANLSTSTDPVLDPIINESINPTINTTTSVKRPLAITELSRNIGEALPVSRPTSPSIHVDSELIESIKNPIAPTNVTVEVNSPSALEPNLPTGGIGGGFGGGGASEGGATQKKKSYKFYWIGAAVLAGVIYLKTRK